ncbi:MAG: twin-arginine translocation signal domain-containing protein [Deltaproteobacteria bacterium]|nr:MAG: twin-arginine translocation signal domain-containing protein [Deltaproteobacteria bacterium]
MSDNGKTTPVSRRDFIRTAALVGGAGAAVQTASMTLWSDDAAAKGDPIPPDYELAKPENILYSTCLQCHVDCQIKAKTWDGTLAKLTGNPYSPQNYLPHLPYDTPPAQAATADGKLCGKGQAGIQTYADPYRLRRVLKRTGPRGSNRWKSISFDQFIKEVVEGGKLFADIGEDRHVPGFSEVIALRDAEVSKQLAADAALVAKGELSVDEFKKRHAQHLDKLIDPDHPDLGPKNNQFVFAAGRIEHGRKELMKRFTHDALGSINAFEHTTICEQSHHIAYSMLSGHKLHHMKPDLANCQFVIFWGTGAFTANFGLTPMAEKVTTGQVERGMKTCVVDPRLSNDAAKADWWLPVRPGTDGALALGMIRWMLDNGRFDARFLENANKAAAAADGEPCWTNATHLVVIEEGEGRRLLKASEVTVGGAPLGTDAQVVVMRGGTPVAVDPEDASTPVEGDLFVATRLGDHEVKTALQLVKEQAFARDLDEVEAITGVPRRQIERVARELTSHGKRAAVELYRGPVQHADGYYAGSAVILLNLLIGNPDHKGGLSNGGGHWHEFGGKPGNVYQFKEMHPGALKAFGVRVTREKARYEDSTLFREQGYPAKRPWYPFSGNVYQEIIPSIAQGYPYPARILFLHKGTPVLATPAGHKQIEMLRDPAKIPLFIACDIVIGETSMYADYIVPDLTYLERWGTPHVTPDVVTKTSKVRQPVARPLTEEVEVDGEVMPLSLEAFLIAVAKRLGVSGFGKDAFGPGMPLDRPEDFFLKAVANMAVGDAPGDAVPDADAAELELFRAARRHLPASVFDEAKWKRAVKPELWPKVVYVLNRGGRFAPYESAYDGTLMKSKMAGMWHIFVEHVAEQKNSMSGKYFSGVPVWRGAYDCAGDPVEAGGDYPFALITYKEPFGGHSRTISNYWGNLGLVTTNHVLMNRRDAARLGLRDGQRVRLVSASNPKGAADLGNGQSVEIAGPLSVVEGIVPGAVAVSWHFGHWAYGSRPVEIDGVRVPGDARRAAGLCPNPVMQIDPKLGDVCLTDPIGASASFYDTRVAVVPA